MGLDGEIILCVPENEIAYCSNHANSYSISIETCHPKSDGKFNEKTDDSLAELLADICKRHKLDPMDDIIRHYDVTGKICPLYHVKNPDEWHKLKQKVADLLDGESEAESIIYSVQVGAFSNIEYAKRQKEGFESVGIACFILQKKVDLQTIYSVQTGAFKMRKNAENMILSLKEIGILDAFIVEKNQAEI